jgi:hypothetical protein
MTSIGSCAVRVKRWRGWPGYLGAGLGLSTLEKWAIGRVEGVASRSGSGFGAIYPKNGVSLVEKIQKVQVSSS